MKPRERFLNKDEIVALLSVCRKSKSPYLYPVTLFALATGARKGEILGLKWEDIDFSRAIATFRDTKNGETRAVHLSSTILKCLQGEQSRRTVLSAYVFSNHDGTKSACIRTAWELAVEETGLKDVVFHSLRHTAASHLAMGGFSTLEIAAILGHKSLSMVKRYSHLSISSTARAIDQMNENIFKECVNV
jgi:integrase